MFCKKCGKELDDAVRFCPNCGDAVESRVDSSYIHIKKPDVRSFSQFIRKDGDGEKVIFLALVALATAFVAIGGLLPLVSFEMFGYSREFSLFEIITTLEEFENAFGISIEGGAMAVLFVIAGCNIIGAIFALRFVVQMLRGVRGAMLMKSVHMAMYWGEAYVVITMGVVWLINAVSADQLFGAKILSLEAACILLAIVPLLNLFVFTELYLGHAVMGITPFAVSEEE